MKELAVIMLMFVMFYVTVSEASGQFRCYEVSPGVVKCLDWVTGEDFIIRK